MINGMARAPLAQELFAAQQRLVEGAAAARPGLTAELARLVGRVGDRLARPPRIVLLGEFNSGKSTLANALIGAQVLPTSIHANTRVPLLIHYADAPTLTYEAHDRERRPLSLSAIEDLRQGSIRMLRVGLPVARLKSFELIDTPGLASGSARVDELGLEACRRSHIAVWCTVASQAWKASEQRVWNDLPKRLQQRGILAVTHKDAIRSERDCQRLMARLDAETATHFGGIAMVAANTALTAGGVEGDAISAWATNGGRELEHLLRTSIETELSSRQTAAERLLQRTIERLSTPASRPVGSLLAT